MGGLFRFALEELMRTRKLVVRRCENSGELGLVFPEMPLVGTDVAMTGDLIAHDLLEHQNGIKNIGSIADELEAIGGIMYVRGPSGYIRPNSIATVHAALANDVSYLHEIACNGVPMRCGSRQSRYFDMDVDFEDILDRAYQNITVEHTLFREEALNCMRLGYRKALNRFKGTCMYSTFWDIAKAVDSIMDCVDYEGQEFYLKETKDGFTCYMKDAWYETY